MIFSFFKKKQKKTTVGDKLCRWASLCNMQQRGQGCWQQGLAIKKNSRNDGFVEASYIINHAQCALV